MPPNNVEETPANKLIKLGLRLGVSAALHPFEYSKVLIQVCDVKIPYIPLAKKRE